MPDRPANHELPQPPNEPAVPPAPRTDAERLGSWQRPTMPWERAAEVGSRSRGGWAGTGFELLAALAIPGALGWWLDGQWGTAPWLAVSLAMLGLTAALVRLVRKSIAAEKADDAARAGRRRGKDAEA